jgi:CO/xanthine dehydrogenase Mo-binding subunit
MLDDLAESSELDPLELRRLNSSRPGDQQADGGTWETHGLVEALAVVGRHPLWQGRGDLPANEGVGLAAACWHGGLAMASAICKFESDGTFSVVLGAPDMTDSNLGMAMIAAETLGVAPSDVDVIVGPTDTSPWAATSAGSKALYTIGEAIRKAAGEVRRQLLVAGAEVLACPVSELDLTSNRIQVTGAEEVISLHDLADRIYRLGEPIAPINAIAVSTQRRAAPMAAVHLVHVKVIPETGEVVPLRYVVAQDVGRAINPLLIEGQILGCVAQGLGIALGEELLHDGSGQLLTGSFMDYAMPRSTDMPPVEVSLVEVPAPDGPFGARGAGEASIIPCPAAVSNAIRAATGLRLESVPMTRPMVWAGLQASSLHEATVE